MIKTVILKGNELKVEGLGGFNTFVQNLSGSVIYASKSPDIVAGADNVAEIPVGSGKLISTTNGTVYLLGTGKAELTGVDSDGVITTGGTAVYNFGGSSDGGASFMEFVNYADTQDEITLNSAKEYANLITQDKADKTELPTTLPANGGNADTVGGFSVGCDVPADAVFTDTIVDISGKLDAQNPVATGSFSLGRKPDTTIGINSFAAGEKLTASGVYSHAEGYVNLASGKSSHAEGQHSAASGECSHAEGGGTKATGEYSHAEGGSTEAAGENSHAEGYLTTASGNNSHAEGKYSIASGIYSHAEGYNVRATGEDSHAEGYTTAASGNFSHAEGRGTKATGDYTHAAGYFTEAVRNYSTVIGAWNKPDDSAESGSMFIIGNGTRSSKLSNLFRIADTGEVYATGAFNAEGADYAEYIKPWFDDNKDNEDRRGYFVTIRGGRLYKAEPGDYIVGITSANPSVIGNGDEDWTGRWVRDEFGSYIYEETESETDSAEKTFVTARKQNPDYDPAFRYIPRRERPEWSAVGMIGVLPLRDDGSCVPGSFAKCGAGGIATAADEWECHKTFFVIERVSENVIKVEMR